MDIDMVKIGTRIMRDDGSIALIPWMQFELFDDFIGVDKGWRRIVQVVYGTTNGHTRVNEDVRYQKRLSSSTAATADPKTARSQYKFWPWKVADMGVAKLDEPFDGEFEGFYRVIQLN